jgi:hypothetical protein
MKPLTRLTPNQFRNHPSLFGQANRVANVLDARLRKCVHCGKDLELEYSELDRKNAADGYTVENTDLVHAKCHQDRQAAKGYT